MSDPSAPPYSRERQVAERAALHAAILTKRVLSSVSEISKEDSSPVTVADFAAQALLTHLVRSEFPTDRFIGEEGSSALRRDDGLGLRVYELFSSACRRLDDEASSSSVPSRDEMLDLIDLGGRSHGGSNGRFWAMDPIDGTAAFLRGEQYAVNVALIQDGSEVVGVIACPNLKLQDGAIHESIVDADGLGIMLSAVKGRGTNVIALSPSPDDALVPRPLDRLEPPASLDRLHIVDCAIGASSGREVMRRLAASLGAPFPGTDVWSSHVRYAALAIGGGHVLVRIPSSPEDSSCIWDHAGAQLIFTEIGGRVTDLDGKAIDFTAGRYLSRNRGLVAAQADIHDKVLSLVQDLARQQL
ncbi:hypothetical protein L249_3578 [Ophiocordyceps polyrhachis-furcata BCC 54312]|uniref:3'(2'),5'-bisphosphate nucleotidase n=1 Tax=Ophiocordyceps polyrhachis-furcata BCC 54312 TaxID=1330021 RepID=A0A367LM71_9HYPO|nr:hypothetical protein L249_3578 [Ophiocordyceps polyrhachis-furcata BCC 54312]